MRLDRYRRRRRHQVAVQLQVRARHRRARGDAAHVEAEHGPIGRGRAVAVVVGADVHRVGAAVVGAVGRARDVLQVGLLARLRRQQHRGRRQPVGGQRHGLRLRRDAVDDDLVGEGLVRSGGRVPVARDRRVLDRRDERRGRRGEAGALRAMDLVAAEGVARGAVPLAPTEVGAVRVQGAGRVERDAVALVGDVQLGRVQRVGGVVAGRRRPADAERLRRALDQDPVVRLRPVEPRLRRRRDVPAHPPVRRVRGQRVGGQDGRIEAELVRGRGGVVPGLRDPVCLERMARDLTVAGAGVDA